MASKLATRRSIEMSNLKEGEVLLNKQKKNKLQEQPPQRHFSSSHINTSATEAAVGCLTAKRRCFIVYAALGLMLLAIVNTTLSAITLSENGDVKQHEMNNTNTTIPLKGFWRRFAKVLEAGLRY